MTFHKNLVMILDHVFNNSYSALMARKRQFNNKLVLQEAARVFALSGYAGTSLDSLVSATGIQRGSIYQAYGSKAGLFCATLEHGVESLRTCSYENTMLYVDLLIVAMWERTAQDAKAASLTKDAVKLLEGRLNTGIANVVGERVKTRANLNI